MIISTDNELCVYLPFISIDIIYTDRIPINKWRLPLSMSREFCLIPGITFAFNTYCIKFRAFLASKVLPEIITKFAIIDYLVMDGLMPERRYSIANALKLRLSCINPSKRSLRRCVTVSPQWPSFLFFLCNWTVMYLTGWATVISHTSPYYIPFVCHELQFSAIITLSIPVKRWFDVIPW